MGGFAVLSFIVGMFVGAALLGSTLLSWSEPATFASDDE